MEDWTVRTNVFQRGIGQLGLMWVHCSSSVYFTTTHPKMWPWHQPYSLYLRISKYIVYYIFYNVLFVTYIISDLFSALSYFQSVSNWSIHMGNTVCRAMWFRRNSHCVLLDARYNWEGQNMCLYVCLGVNSPERWLSDFEAIQCCLSSVCVEEEAR